MVRAGLTVVVGELGDESDPPGPLLEQPGDRGVQPAPPSQRQPT